MVKGKKGIKVELFCRYTECNYKNDNATGCLNE